MSGQLALSLGAAPPVPESAGQSVPRALTTVDRERLRDHEAAMRQPRPGFEAALVRLLGGMADYAEAHSKAYESTPITHDYYIGEAWERLGNALHDMLNGETGRLDGGAMSASIYRLIEGEGKPAAIAAVREETMPPKPEPGDSKIGIGRSALSDRQRQLLSHVEVKDNVAVYTSNDRIPDWDLLKRVMLALGGTWKTGGKKAPGGFRFPDDLDAAELVRLAKETGEITDPKVAEAFFTPDTLADVLVERIGHLDPGAKVLEPSAGEGALVRALLRRHPTASITAVEALQQHVVKLAAIAEFKGPVLGGDFLDARDIGPFAAVAQNPPFSREIEHVRHAYKFLAPGGVLVAIMSAGIKYREDKARKAFRAWVAENDGCIWENPEGSFLESGTGVRSVMVRVRKGGG